MRPIPFPLRAALLASPLLLAGCGDQLSRTFGLTRDAPDEFQVTTRAPLSMPPSYTLRPPTPGATRPQELPLSTQAEAALVPEAALGGGGGTSPGQQAILAAAGPPAPPGIRETVDQEAQLDRPGQGFTDQLLFWKSTPPAGTVVNPQQENARLHRDAALGKLPDAGATPAIQPESQGPLGGLF